MEKVKVIFRMENNPYTKAWECIAFLPEMQASDGNIACYTTEGYCEASCDYYRDTRKAAPEEYAETYRRIRADFMPYELDVRQKMSTKMYNDLARMWRGEDI